MKKLKSNDNQTWDKDAIGAPAYVNDVKGHTPNSCVIWGQVRRNMLLFIMWVSFEKLKSNWNQAWVKDAIEVPLYIDAVKYKFKGYLRSS